MNVVRHEGAFGGRPKQGVDCLDLGKRVAEEHDLEVAQIGLLGQPAGKRPPLFRRRAFQNIKIDSFGHFAAARWTKKSTSSGTGRPVLPFCEPLSHAVPATSRCAQCRSLANFQRNEAAVQAPPSRPPTFAISAKLLFNCSTYSSPIGSRQARSSAQMPADCNSPASASSLLIK